MDDGERVIYRTMTSASCVAFAAGLAFLAACSDSSTDSRIVPESGKAATCGNATCAGSELCWKHATDTSVAPYCAPPPPGCVKGDPRMPENCKPGCRNGIVRDDQAVNWFLGEVTCSGS